MNIAISVFVAFAASCKGVLPSLSLARTPSGQHDVNSITTSIFVFLTAKCNAVLPDKSFIFTPSGQNAIKAPTASAKPSIEAKCSAPLSILFLNIRSMLQQDSQGFGIVLRSEVEWRVRDFTGSRIDFCAVPQNLSRSVNSSSQHMPVQRPIPSCVAFGVPATRGPRIPLRWRLMAPFISVQSGSLGRLLCTFCKWLLLQLDHSVFCVKT
jgi:hypothetical protein